jgi:hypothetical protein
MLEGKCSKDGLLKARKHRFRFARPSPLPGARLSAVSASAVGEFGSPRRPGSARSAVYSPDSVSSDRKSPRRIFRRGLGCCDHEDMPVICPTCQKVFAGPGGVKASIQAA